VPSVSKKQHNFMAAVAKNPGFAKKVGVPAKVGQEFLTADKGKKFGSGGAMKKKMRKFQDGGETGFEDSGGMEYLKKMAGRYAEQPKSGLDKLRSDLKSTGRAGMAGAKAAVESIPVVRGAKELASRIGQKSMPKSYDEEMGMKKGGMAKKKMMGGGMTKMAKGGGIESKGKTKGKMVKMAKGGGIEVKGKTKGKMVKMAKGGRAC